MLYKVFIIKHNRMKLLITESQLEIIVNHIQETTKQKTILIQGMTCGHCSSRVEKALNALEGVEAKVDLANNKATVSGTGTISDELLTKVKAEREIALSTIKEKYLKKKEEGAKKSTSKVSRFDSKATAPAEKKTSKW